MGRPHTLYLKFEEFHDYTMKTVPNLSLLGVDQLKCWSCGLLFERFELYACNIYIFFTLHTYVYLLNTFMQDIYIYIRIGPCSKQSFGVGGGELNPRLVGGVATKPLGIGITSQKTRS